MANAAKNDSLCDAGRMEIIKTVLTGKRVTYE
jgi:hypothetical protein